MNNPLLFSYLLDLTARLNPAAPKAMVVIAKLLGMHLAQITDTLESLIERRIITTNDLVAWVFRNVYKPLYILWKHVQSTSPCLMDTGVHIVIG